MISALDTNILLDILIPDAEFSKASKTVLDKAHKNGSLILNEVVYAELCSQFLLKASLDQFLAETGIRFTPSTPDALSAASLAWRDYLSKKRKGNTLCDQCGVALQWKCPHCHAKVPGKRHILCDFLIGGHAITQADRLLTRDRGYYRTYFKTLDIFDPNKEQYLFQ